MRRLIFAGSLATLVAAGIVAPDSGSLSGQQLADEVNVPQGELALGSVTIPRQVMANGEALPPGDYDVHLTADSASPAAVGALDVLERWVEFRQGGEVRGREVVTIVPEGEVGEVAETAVPGAGTARVEMLKDDEYLRVWINQSGVSYLIHLVVA